MKVCKNDNKLQIYKCIKLGSAIIVEIDSELSGWQLSVLLHSHLKKFQKFIYNEYILFFIILHICNMLCSDLSSDPRGSPTMDNLKDILHMTSYIWFRYKIVSNFYIHS